MFADEARFGRINRPRPCWAPIGTRPEVASQLIREYIYLYGAVCPKDGTCVYLIMPTSNTACFQAFLQALARKFARQDILLVLDGAPNHRCGDLAAVADDEREGEVGPARSSREASEQSGLGCGGARGAKGRGQGECGTAKHGPDAEPGSRVTSAGPHTRSRHQEQAGQADGASASHQHRRLASELLRSEEDRSAGRRRGDVDRVCKAPGGEPPGPACSRPHRGVSSAAVAPEVYTEGGRQTAAARHRCHRGQDRPGCGGGNSDADL